MSTDDLCEICKAPHTRCPTCGEDLHNIDLGARAHAILTDEENAKLKARIAELEAERDAARQDVAGCRAVLVIDRDAFIRAFQTARRTLERIRAMVDGDGVNSRDDVLGIGLIAGRAIAALDSGARGEAIVRKPPGECAVDYCGRAAAAGSEWCDRHADDRPATPAAPRCAPEKEKP